MKAQECSIYEGCNQCLGARDPYCGWCSLENKCSLRRDCRDATQDPQHWVSYKTGRCTTITQVMPDKLQRTTARTVSCNKGWTCNTRSSCNIEKLHKNMKTLIALNSKCSTVLFQTLFPHFICVLAQSVLWKLVLFFWHDQNIECKNMTNQSRGRFIVIRHHIVYTVVLYCT